MPEIPSYFGLALLHFAIYAPELGISEGLEHRQLLYYVASVPPVFSDTKLSTDQTLSKNSAIVSKFSPAVQNQGTIPGPSLAPSTNDSSIDNPSLSKERSVSLETKLLHIGLAQALVNFSSLLKTNSFPISLSSKKSLSIVVNLEPGVWALLCVCLPRSVFQKQTQRFYIFSPNPSNPNNTPLDSDLKVTYHSDFSYSNYLEKFVLLQYEAYKLLHGKILLSQDIKAQSKLKISISKFFSKTIWSWEAKWSFNSLSSQEKTSHIYPPMSKSSSLQLPNNNNELSLIAALETLPRIPLSNLSSEILLDLWACFLNLYPSYVGLQKYTGGESSSGTNDVENIEPPFVDSKPHSPSSQLKPTGMLVLCRAKQLVWSSFLDSHVENPISKTKSRLGLDSKNSLITRALLSYAENAFFHEFESVPNSSHCNSTPSNTPSLDSQKIDTSKTQNTDSSTSQKITSVNLTESPNKDFSNPIFFHQSSSQSLASSSSSSTSLPENKIPLSLTEAFSSVVSALVEPSTESNTSNIPFLGDSNSLQNLKPSNPSFQSFNFSNPLNLTQHDPQSRIANSVNKKRQHQNPLLNLSKNIKFNESQNSSELLDPQFETLDPETSEKAIYYRIIWIRNDPLVENSPYIPTLLVSIKFNSLLFIFLLNAECLFSGNQSLSFTHLHRLDDPTLYYSAFSATKPSFFLDSELFCKSLCSLVNDFGKRICLVLESSTQSLILKINKNSIFSSFETPLVLFFDIYNSVATSNFFIKGGVLPYALEPLVFKSEPSLNNLPTAIPNLFSDFSLAYKLPSNISKDDPGPSDPVFTENIIPDTASTKSNTFAFLNFSSFKNIFSSGTQSIDSDNNMETGEDQQQNQSTLIKQNASGAEYSIRPENNNAQNACSPKQMDSASNINTRTEYSTNDPSIQKPWIQFPNFGNLIPFSLGKPQNYQNQDANSQKTKNTSSKSKSLDLSAIKNPNRFGTGFSPELESVILSVYNKLMSDISINEVYLMEPKLGGCISAMRKSLKSSTDSHVSSQFICVAFFSGNNINLNSIKVFMKQVHLSLSNNSP
ncbi:hypothetical protein BB560_002359 [Smittium megazygosporum]|uniref:CCZ1/INTU/HSP4 first Longin domain-containing protein n=1 Tax=Smittium megazygosporum TaxID=133381 RepID=A0A2T9ZF26_9FUNG|nr:hypothetical protein BB560_002359 [Smittium megazygosporum]